MEINIPNTKTIQLSQAEQFAEAVKVVANKCKVSTIHYNKLGMLLGFDFEDGSKINTRTLMVYCDWVPNDNFIND